MNKNTANEIDAINRMLDSFPENEYIEDSKNTKSNNDSFSKTDKVSNRQALNEMLDVLSEESEKIKKTLE